MWLCTKNKDPIGEIIAKTYELWSKTPKSNRVEEKERYLNMAIDKIMKKQTKII